MSIRQKLAPFLKFHAVPAGSQAPDLSLTADEGTWIKLKDLKGRVNVVLVFFRSMLDDETDAYLKSLDRARGRFEQLDTVIFGVNQKRTDKLREFRARHGLEFFLLYDPFALTARTYGCSGRVRPLCKPGVVLVGKDGLVRHSARGFTDIEVLLREVAGTEGAEVPPEVGERTFTGLRDPGAPAAEAQSWLALEAKEHLEKADISYAVVDVRTLNEYEGWHLPGSINIPLDEMPHRYTEIGQTTHILCLDWSGGLAQAAAEFLTSVGRSDVYYVRDGLDNWPR